MELSYHRTTCQLGIKEWLDPRYLIALFAAILSPLIARADGKLSVLVDGKPVDVNASGSISVSSNTKNVTFRFEEDKQAGSPARIRYKLDGVDNRWRDGSGEMFFAVRFMDASGDQFGQTTFKVTGESAGWGGSLAQSTFTHRKETISVPAGAASFWFVISSAGPPATVGIYGVKEISAFQLSHDRPPVPIAFASPPLVPDNGSSVGWVKDGSRRSMAKLATVDRPVPSDVLEIQDDAASAHAEWRTSKDAVRRLDGTHSLTLEWDEVFSIGISDSIQASYEGFTPGQYTFRIQRTDTQGSPIGDELRLHLNVRPPFWKSSWFWIVLVSAGCASAVGSSRYREWRRMRAEITRFRQERALDRERLRIAQDIHDDLGARATHISLISAMGRQHASDPDQASATFDQISKLTRDLVFALYQTVWAVDPENDSLEALVDHLCQIASKQCTPANIRCRLHIDRFPEPLVVSSEARHNISMAVSEAVHNAIKHSHAEEISLKVKINGTSLEIAVCDNGSGFDPKLSEAGNGLVNMRRRMARIEGSVQLAPDEVKGSIVALSVPLSRLSGPGTADFDGQ